METLIAALSRATVTVPPPVVSWMVETAVPLFQPWRELLRRNELSDQQAWECLWRGDALIKSARKIPGKWTANATSYALADTVALYLSRPDVPSGRISLVRTRLDVDQHRRIDLLRSVTRLDGGDAVCREIVAEPPPGSTRDEHVGLRELALIERYRQSARDEAEDRDSKNNLQHDGVIARAAEARRSDRMDQLLALKACLFGLGTVAARPEDADLVTAQYLLTLGRNASIYQHSDLGLGEVLSALRPILRAYINPGYTPPRSWVSDRLLTFGEACVVPLGHSVYAEDGNYVVRRFGSSVDKYEALSKLAAEPDSVPLGELCDRVEAEHVARHRWINEQAAQSE